MVQRWFRVVVAAVMALGNTACAAHLIQHVEVMTSRNGESLLIQARASFMDVSYLRRRSLENGALLASVSVVRSDTEPVRWNCVPALPGRLWCEESFEGLRMRDAESLEIIATADQTLRRLPEAVRPRHLGCKAPVSMGPEKTGYGCYDVNGYQWVIDPTTLTPARSPWLDLGSTKRKYAFPPGTNEGDGYAITGDGARGALVRRERSGEHGVMLHPEHTYLGGKIVAGLDNPPRLLVIERVPDRDPTLWCLFADGSVQWKVTNVAEGEFAGVRVIKLYRDTIVFATYNKLLSIRAQDGAVVWTSPP